MNALIDEFEIPVADLKKAVAWRLPFFPRPGVPVSTLINWFEIPVADLERAVAFYEAVFAVTLRREEHDGVSLAVFPYAAPATGGALCRSPLGEPGAAGTIPYLDGGADLAQPLARALEQGGRLLMDKTLVSPEIGHIALFADSEGNTIGLHSRPRA